MLAGRNIFGLSEVPLRIQAIRALSPPRFQCPARDIEQTCRPTKSLCPETLHFVSRVSRTSGRTACACTAATIFLSKCQAPSPSNRGLAQDRQSHLPTTALCNRFGLTDRHC